MVSVRANVLPDGARYNRDNVVATLAFRDGSIANVLYLANGDRSVPKEQFEVFCAGKVGRIDDFCTLDLAHEGTTSVPKLDATKDMHEKSNLPWKPYAGAVVLQFLWTSW